MRLSLRTDRVAGVLLAGAALLYWIEARKFETGFMADPIGPKAFPYVLGATLFFLSLWLVARPQEDAAWPQSGIWWKWALVSMSLLLYASVLTSLGFIISTSLLLTLLALLFGARPSRGVAFAVVFSLVTHVFFDRLLALSLPVGNLFQGILAGGG